MKNIVILTGAGVSAESGLSTFRDSNGLWNNHSIYEVATPEAWLNNKQLVLDFYNHRRSDLQKVKPNAAHLSLASLEKHFNTQIITQNVDNLHEQSGSKNVLHLHGLLTQARGELSTNPIIDIGYTNIQLGDVNINGEQLRPNIVWFGEDVPLIEQAHKICLTADLLIIIGTSLQVYPAAGLIHSVSKNCSIYLIDPKADEINDFEHVNIIKQKASIAVPKLILKIINSF
jgi:NAD-dependent deacetylase